MKASSPSSSSPTLTVPPIIPALAVLDKPSPPDLPSVSLLSPGDACVFCGPVAESVCEVVGVDVRVSPVWVLVITVLFAVIVAAVVALLLWPAVNWDLGRLSGVLDAAHAALIVSYTTPKFLESIILRQSTVSSTKFPPLLHRHEFISVAELPLQPDVEAAV
jgi:hypothetical protein